MYYDLVKTCKNILKSGSETFIKYSYEFMISNVIR